MLTILHGDDIVASRNKLTSVADSFRGYDRLNFVGKNTDITDVIQAFEAQSLFGQKKLILLEEFLETKDKLLIASLLNHLKKDQAHEVIFWEPKEIKGELLALFPKSVQTFFFKQEQPLFRFLDAIGPGNAKQMISLFHEVIKRESAELVFYMIIRQFRLLLGVTSGGAISEVKRLAPWQKARLERQARQFSSEKLIIFYRKLFQIERETKTGLNALPLSVSLDLFLAEL